MTRFRLNLLAAAVVIAGGMALSRPAHATVIVNPAEDGGKHCCTGGGRSCCGPNWCSVSAGNCNAG